MFIDAWFAGGPEPVPDSGLINGAGRYVGGPAVERARINVKHGKRYRLRLIGLSAEGDVLSFLGSGVGSELMPTPKEFLNFPSQVIQ